MNNLEKRQQGAQSSNTSIEIEANSSAIKTTKKITCTPPPNGETTTLLDIVLTYLFFSSWDYANSYGISINFIPSP
ncbi:hypothetical protein SS1G_10878 [Sclerotinia sclerotiorum 1980 UF-70]|uniref:Uncharacterized protein n=2 Tax=Sclerotinia sclerotiorum (strain ATCC 18683 / 1980 / Ss-1) TaxID=665079 RepID=A7EZW1_SCLS1|nr:hypothetical protein SS1G_10878 [Sclerotinia sclerotiorum 1980 UF-70]APA12151.1 hypothetical protein sscle_09g069210 [Sclerotinia sclerotiorum 1980 UF-70]EDN95003.1 hypothetical protein SS1G_10878 [Sclerotinia sclerotiorum 1980 UF-70]